MNGKEKMFKAMFAVGVAFTAFALCSCTGHEERKRREEVDKYSFLERTWDIKTVERDGEKDIEIPGIQELLDAGYSQQALEIVSRRAERLRGAASAGRKAVSPFYADLIMLDGDEELPVKLSLSSAPLIDALPIFASTLGFDFIVDSEIKSVITLNIDSIMTREALWEVLDQALFIAGCTGKLENGLVRIVPLARAAAQWDLELDGADSELIIFPLNHITASAAVEAITPFLGTNSTVRALASSNSVLISDNRQNIPKIHDILSMIDLDQRSGWPHTAFRCRNVMPTMAAAELATLLPVLGFNVDIGSSPTASAQNQNTSGAIQIFGIDRLQMLVVSAATEEVLDEVGKWVKVLDASNAAEQERVFIYKAGNSRADDLMVALQAIFNVEGASLRVTSTNTNTEDNRATNTAQVGSVNRTNSTQGVDSLPNTLIDRASNVFETPIKLFCDGVQNRLVFRTTPRAYAMVKAVLDRLDTVPAQVLVQVMIVEVSLNDSTEFGIEFSMADERNDANSLLQTNYAGLRPADGAGEGLSYLITNPNDPEQKFAYIRAKAGKNNVRVVSSPQVLVSSHSTARVQVGDQVPVVTQAYTNTSSGGETAQNYEYRDTGVILQITPQVTGNDLISFEISQTISDAVVNTISQLNTPVLSIREVSSTMTIANGQSMIIGGMIQESSKQRLDGVPIIASIPILNSLTGQTNNSTKRTELLIIITGYIIDERSPVEDLLRRYNESVRALNKFEMLLDDEHRKDQKRLNDFLRSERLNAPDFEESASGGNGE